MPQKVIQVIQATTPASSQDFGGNEGWSSYVIFTTHPLTATAAFFLKKRCQDDPY